MSKNLKAIRGMRDILPGETHKWQFIEQRVKALFDCYGYQEIRTPIVEMSELFHRSIGENTDIVSKEMYSFEDRNGDGLTLRPEGTAAVVRAGIEHALFSNQQVQKLWYQGPMFRHERPQLGRQRQFHQIGVETFGLAGPDIDAEMLLLTARLWSELQIPDLELEINSLGTASARARYREILVEYFTEHRSSLDEDSQVRLNNNPLRILDSKNPDLAELIAAAPVFMDYIDDESNDHFQGLCAYLDQAELSYRINPRLVRGLDYYSKTVFEWVTDRLGAQGTVCAGGRYDGLIEQFTGKPAPAIGFAMGIERLIAVMDSTGFEFPMATPDVYLILAGAAAEQAGLHIAEQLRDQLPGLNLVCHHGGGSFKSQFKKADKSAARLALILGEDELEQNTIGLKFLREDRAQESLPLADLGKKLAEYL